MDVNLGRSAAANPIIDLELHPRQIVSTATKQAVFIDGKVDGVPASILTLVLPLQLFTTDFGNMDRAIHVNYSKSQQDPLQWLTANHCISSDKLRVRIFWLEY